MDGVQYITNPKGKPQYVVIDLSLYKDAVEEFLADLVDKHYLDTHEVKAELSFEEFCDLAIAERKVATKEIEKIKKEYKKQHRVSK